MLDAFVVGVVEDDLEELAVDCVELIAVDAEFRGKLTDVSFLELRLAAAAATAAAADDADDPT